MELWPQKKAIRGPNLSYFLDIVTIKQLVLLPLSTDKCVNK